MMHPERGKLIPVTGNNNSPDMDEAVDVQFNPTSLKVSLSNTLKENQRNGNTRSSQYVDKSSSSLTVELIFDTTYIEAAPTESGAESSEPASPPADDALTQGSDVRNQTKKIAERFIKPIPSGNKKKAPKRCLFQWGSFEFVGLVESYEETLDFFSKEGRPLRATVSLKLKEDRYQFRQRTSGVQAAQQTAPTLSPTGNTDDDTPSNSARPPRRDTSPVPGASNDQPGNWRDTSMFNGIENPRLPSASMLAIPQVSASASIGVGGNFGAKGNIGISAKTTASVTPSFNFGASSSLGTQIEGAFNAGLRTTSSSSVSLKPM